MMKWENAKKSKSRESDHLSRAKSSIQNPEKNDAIQWKSHGKKLCRTHVRNGYPVDGAIQWKCFEKSVRRTHVRDGYPVDGQIQWICDKSTGFVGCRTHPKINSSLSSN